MNVRARPRWQGFVFACVVLLLAAAWGQGVFDNFLWRVGLNYNACATNGYGATFCGADLKRYQQRMRAVGIEP